MQERISLRCDHHIIVEGEQIHRFKNGSVEIAGSITEVPSCETVEVIVCSSLTSQVCLKAILLRHGKKFHSLNSKTYIELPEDADFLDVYEGETPSKIFVSYSVGYKKGLLLFEARSLSIVVPHEEGYKNFLLKDNFIYVEDEKGVFYIYNLCGDKFLLQDYKKCDMLPIIYNLNKVVCLSKFVDIPEEILHVTCTSQNNTSWVTVETQNKAYYFDKNLTLYFSMELPEFYIKVVYTEITDKSFYVYAKKLMSEKIVRLFYVEKKKDGYLVRSLSMDLGIEPRCVQAAEGNGVVTFFIMPTAAGLYSVYSHNLKLLMSDVSYPSIYYKKNEQFSSIEYANKYHIVGRMSDGVIKICLYDSCNPEKYQTMILNPIFGFKNLYIADKSFWMIDGLTVKHVWNCDSYDSVIQKTIVDGRYVEKNVCFVKSGDGKVIIVDCEGNII